MKQRGDHLREFALRPARWRQPASELAGHNNDVLELGVYTRSSLFREELIGSFSSAGGLSGSSSPVTEVLKERRPLPSELPISGSLRAPKISSNTAKIIRSSGRPNGPNLMSIPRANLSDT